MRPEVADAIERIENAGIRNAYPQNIRVNRPSGGGFGVVTVDFRPEGTQVTFMSVKILGSVEDRIDEASGDLILGVASLMLKNTANAELRVIA